MPDVPMFDLIVIGGGPGGYSTAIAAAKAGLKVALFEMTRLGGTCLNIGCIPTKYLLDKAAFLEKTRSLGKNGVVKQAGQYSFKKIQEGKAATVKKLTDGVGGLLKAAKVTVVIGKATLQADRAVLCNGLSYKAKDIILATGSQPMMIPIPGAELTVDSTSALALQSIPRRMAVIGGGVIGLELASAYSSFGSDVVVIEMADKILPNEEPASSAYLRKALEGRGIRILTSCKVESITKSGETKAVNYIGKDGKTAKAEADVVLMAIGRKAYTDGVLAPGLKLDLDRRGCIVVDENMKSSVDHVYAIGDVIGGYQLAHVAYSEGEIALRSILGTGHEGDKPAVPRCVYTIPPFAATGMTSEEAKKNGFEPVTGRFSYDANGMAMAENASGFVMMIMDKNSHVTLGAQIVGENAPEMVAFASTTVTKKYTLSDWEKIIIAHPSLTEMFKEAALDAFGKAIHKV